MTGWSQIVNAIPTLLFLHQTLPLDSHYERCPQSPEKKGSPVLADRGPTVLPPPQAGGTGHHHRTPLPPRTVGSLCTFQVAGRASRRRVAQSPTSRPAETQGRSYFRGGSLGLPPNIQSISAQRGRAEAQPPPPPSPPHPAHGRLQGCSGVRTPYSPLWSKLCKGI